jgi:hypothetical protein
MVNHLKRTAFHIVAVLMQAADDVQRLAAVLIAYGVGKLVKASLPAIPATSETNFASIALPLPAHWSRIESASRIPPSAILASDCRFVGQSRFSKPATCFKRIAIVSG